MKTTMEAQAVRSDLELWRASLPLDLQEPDRQLDTAIVRAHCRLAREKAREALSTLALASYRLGADCAMAMAIVGSSRGGRR